MNWWKKTFSNSFFFYLPFFKYDSLFFNFSNIFCQLYNFTLIYTCPQPKIGVTAAIFAPPPPSFVQRLLYFVKCGKREGELERERGEREIERGERGRDRGEREHGSSCISKCDHLSLEKLYKCQILLSLLLFPCTIA